MKYITEAKIRKIGTLWEGMYVTKFKHMMNDQLLTNHTIQTNKQNILLLETAYWNKFESDIFLRNISNDTKISFYWKDSQEKSNMCS